MRNSAARRKVINRSLRGNDAFNRNEGQFFNVLVAPNAASMGVLPSDLPLELFARDRILYVTPRHESQWGAAVGIAITKMASVAWDIKSTVRAKRKRFQELLLTADTATHNGGWVRFAAKITRDYTCTNNGCFVEIVRDRATYGSKIIGINHLPSYRCRRTGDPDYPVIFTDRYGREHFMKWFQVMEFCDMPETQDEYMGGGLCAAERAYQQIKKTAALESYVFDKVSGLRPLAIHIINGMTTKQLERMLSDGADGALRRGLTSYMGAIVAATLQPDQAPGLVTIPLAELPDGFDPQQERDRADLIYANALGLDPQDIKPIGNQQMGAGAQSVVLHEKAKGRGLAAFRQAFTHQINWMVLDDRTRFLFTEHDAADKQRKAETMSRVVAAIAALAKQNILNGPQSMQLLSDWEIVPREFIPEDITPVEAISDTEKQDVDDRELSPEEAEQLQASGALLGDPTTGIDPFTGKPITPVPNAMADTIDRTASVRAQGVQQNGRGFRETQPAAPKRIETRNDRQSGSPPTSPLSRRVKEIVSETRAKANGVVHE